MDADEHIRRMEKNIRHFTGVSEIEYHFTNIYQPNRRDSQEFHQSGGESVCGGGSKKNVNQDFLKYLQKIMNEYNIKSIVDVGCGDLNYISAFLEDNPKIKYTGVDISKPLLEQNKSEFPHLDFQHHNICETFPTQKFDLCIIKEVFIHLSKDMVSQTLKRIKKQNNVKYLLISGHTNECQIDGGLSGYKDSDYGHFAYHFYGLDENHLSELVDCEVRLSRLYEIDSILD
jgi:hypothetical protein|tara:strand:+ start:1270 stop:1959 length:690 start_codon:yes stop_codon:yes gene_type:complete